MTRLMDERVRGVEQLARIRDELRVQAALARAEMRDRWEHLEVRWHELEGKLERIEETAEASAEDVREAAQRLAEEIGESYERMREALGREAPAVPGLERIARLRDELRLQIALGRAEARKEWERAESRWDELRRRLHKLQGASAEAAEEIREAAGDLVKEIAEGYERLRKAL